METTMNTAWGKTIIDQLVQQGVDYFCISPGFRSAPLSMAVAEHQGAKSFIHFDERGAAFHALGYAKATKKPAAVIVTSGTAVGNLMPAVMEAWASETPLFLLTCDRPAELRDTMANQTADQTKIFAQYVHYFCDLPSPTSQVPDRFLATTIGRAVSQCKGPVHLNCPFREPLFDNTNSVPIPPTIYTHPKPVLSAPELWAKKLENIDKGVIVLGANANAPAAKELSEKLGWPILADIISSYRELADERAIPYYHHILQSHPNLKADAVLHLGDACVSKTLLNWMADQPNLFHIAAHAKRCDPHHQVVKRVICPPNTFCKQVAPHIEKKQGAYFQEWKELSSLISIDPPPSTEPGLIKTLESEAPSDHALFFGNSMPIRDADMFFFPKTPCGPIFANRGLSGIDGNIATCAGIAETQSVIALIGDQTFLHDLNSLAQLKKTKYPVKLIVVNNGGGGIFSFLPIEKEALNTYFAAAHNLELKSAAQLFGFNYCKSLAELLESKTSCIIEIVTNREENRALHEQIDQQAKDKLCTSFSTVS